jgi:hypothetical protein
VQADGGPRHGPALPARGLKPALRRVGIREVRLRGLPASCASNPLAAGVHVVTVSRLIGRASLEITLAIDSHGVRTRGHVASEQRATLRRDSGSRMETAVAAKAIQPRAQAPKSLDSLEASAAIEPACTDLQATFPRT